MCVHSILKDTFGHKLLINGSDDVSKHATVEFIGDHLRETSRRNGV